LDTHSEEEINISKELSLMFHLVKPSKLLLQMKST